VNATYSMIMPVY